MRRNDVIYFGIVIVLVILCFVLLYYMRSETAKCVQNPFNYGAIKMGGVSCSCTQSENNCIYQFFFNETNFKSEVAKCMPKYP